MSAEFAALVESPAHGDERAAVRVGVEHEYGLFDSGYQVDFGAWIHRLSLGVRYLDPADPNAYWLPSGAALTCDGREAEIALAPTVLQPGFAGTIEARAQAGWQRLRRLLASRVDIQGYSTHLSIATAPTLGDQVARSYVRRFAPALMLMMNGCQSPGVLVRPRPGRTELCGEFIAGSRLRAGAAFAAGSTLAVIQTCDGHRAAMLPPAIESRPEPAVRRYGWYVDRASFGRDLHSAGRRTMLRRESGGLISAQDHLELAWSVAREALNDCTHTDDVDVAERMVMGSLPLPGEVPASETQRTVVRDVSLAQGNVRRPRGRPGFELAPVMITWDVAVYLLVDTLRRRRAFACVPTVAARRFLYRLLHGDLDDVFNAYLALPGAGRRLEHAGQTAVAGLYDRMAPRSWLLPMERATGVFAQSALRA